MSAIANVVLTDATPVTPVDYTWVPSKIEGNLATWRESARFNGVVDGESVLTLSVVRPTGGSKVTKVRAKLVIPYLDSTTNAVKYSMTADLTFLVPNGSTAQDRLDLSAFIGDMMTSSVVKDSLEGLDNIY